MWTVSIRDLLYRKRRFAIAVVATALVFAMTLLLSGVSYSIHHDNRRMVGAMGADAWVVGKGASGPFTALSVLPGSAVAAVAKSPGVDQADPLIIFQSTIGTNPPKPVNLIGIRPGGLGTRTLAKGRQPTGPGEVVADTKLGYHVGQKVVLRGHPVTVVGTAPGLTYFFGNHTILTSVGEAQKIAFAGQPVVSAVLVKGNPTGLPPTLHAVTPHQVLKDLELPAKSATQTIDFLKILLWLIAAGIIGSMIYLSSMERTRDFAVLKATGTTNRALLGDLALQAVVLATAAAIVAAVLAHFVLAPVFPFEVVIPRSTFVTLPLVALLVGLVASLAGLRRAVTVEPALAFGGA